DDVHQFGIGLARPGFHITRGAADWFALRVSTRTAIGAREFERNLEAKRRTYRSAELHAFSKRPGYCRSSAGDASACRDWIIDSNIVQASRAVQRAASQPCVDGAHATTGNQVP